MTVSTHRAGSARFDSALSFVPASAQWGPDGRGSEAWVALGLLRRGIDWVVGVGLTREVPLQFVWPGLGAPLGPPVSRESAKISLFSRLPTGQESG